VFVNIQTRKRKCSLADTLWLASHKIEGSGSEGTLVHGKLLLRSRLSFTGILDAHLYRHSKSLSSSTGKGIFGSGSSAPLKGNRADMLPMNGRRPVFLECLIVRANLR